MGRDLRSTQCLFSDQQQSSKPLFILNRSVSARFKKITAAFIMASFVLVTALASDASAAEPKTKAKTSLSSAKQKSARPAAKSSTKKKTNVKKKPVQHTAYSPPHGSIVIDADTGTVISQSNADARVYPASLTKLMTLLLTFEGIEHNNVNLFQRVQITSNAARQPPSKLDLPAGSSILMRDAIYAVVTKSANDIAVAIGENVGGTEGRFVYLMNQKAQQLGMNHTHFVNPSGLHNPQQVTTPRDFARLARYIVKNYPREYRYFATRSFTYNGTVNRNHNRLMETYQGMDGMKTGYTIPSGFNLVGSAVRNNRRLIAVVMGGKTAQMRNNEVAGLLDDGFEKLANPQSQQLVAQNTIDLPDHRTVSTAGAASTRQQTNGTVATVTAQTPVNVNIPVASRALTVATINPAEPVPMPATGTMSEIAGQGDIDPAIAKRFETGMMAINAIKTLKPGQTSGVPVNMGSQQAAYDPAGTKTMQLSNDSNDWAIQLGSYNSRLLSDQVLASAITKLPGNLRPNAKPIIVPLKAGEGWVYRARLHGFSREEASAACKYFNNCMAISPRAF